MTRRQQWYVVIAFLAVIYIVPLMQTIAEVAHGQLPQFFDVFRSLPSRPTLRAYEKELEEQSLVACATRPPIQYVRFLLFGEAGEKVLAGKSGWLFYRPDVRYLVERGNPSEDPFLAIKDFADQLRNRGIRLLVLPVPGKPALHWEMLTSRLNHADRVDSPTLALLARLRTAGIDAIDLFELFGRDKSHVQYLARDTHWSAETAEFAAVAVGARLKALGWIQPGTVDYHIRQVTVPRRSDIARMTRTPLIEAAYPAEEVIVHQVREAETGELYRDDPAASVLVLGDSFLRIYQTDEPKGGGFIAHLARNLRQPVASVVNDGGASTLVRQQLARRPQLLSGKSVVVWEFVERDIRFGTDGWQVVPIPIGSRIPGQELARNP